MDSEHRIGDVARAALTGVLFLVGTILLLWMLPPQAATPPAPAPLHQG